MAAKCQRPRNIPKVAEGPLGCGRRGPEAWEQQGGTRAPDASFCDWERDPTLRNLHRPGRAGVSRGSAGSVPGQGKCWGRSCRQHPRMACDALLRGAAACHLRAAPDPGIATGSS